MPWYRDSEDADGTRHYSTYNPFTGGGAWPPTKRTLTRRQRQRMNRTMGLVWLLSAAAGIAGWVVGVRTGHSALRGVIGVVVALLCLWVLAMVFITIWGIAGGLKKPPPRA